MNIFKMNHKLRPMMYRESISNRRHGEAAHALHIDRRLHLDLALQRQSELERRIEAASNALRAGEVVEVENLEMMERLLGSSLSVILMYSKVRSFEPD